MGTLLQIEYIQQGVGHRYTKPGGSGTIWCRQQAAQQIQTGAPKGSGNRMTLSATTASAKRLRVGDLVEVRSAEEIMATLDERGELENLPFMPEMLEFCGQRLTVHKVAHKLCDTITRTGIHKMDNAVHLTGSRCDGVGARRLPDGLLAVLEGSLAQARRAR